jgi:hypothetical protein
MLTIRTSAHILTNRHRKNFRSITVSTGAPLARVGALRQIQEWIRLFDAESRRLWLEMQWRSHLERVQFARVRSRP